MQTLTAKAARSNFDQLMDRCAQSHQPILITSKCTDAVLLSAEDWEEIQEKLIRLATAGMREFIREGMAERVGQCTEKPDC